MAIGGWSDLTKEQEKVFDEPDSVENPFEGMEVTETENPDGSLTLEALDTEVPSEDILFAEHDANLADFIDTDTLGEIAAELIEHIEQDKQDRADWEEIFADGMELLGLKQIDGEDLPFDGAANVVHPMLMEAIVDFQAKAYAELFPSKGPIKTQVVGDASPEVVAQARRVKEYMNYQVQHEIEEYGPETDRLLFMVAYFGTAFSKTYYDPTLGRLTKEAIRPDNVFMPYHCTTLTSASRYTHRIYLTKNDILIRQAEGFYSPTENGPLPGEDTQSSGSNPELSELQNEIDELEGKSFNAASTEELFEVYESYVRYVLPGDEDVNEDGEPTGIALPYIITILKDTGEILAIRRNWDEADPMKRPQEYMVKYDFIPGLGCFGYGYLHLIGGLTKTSTAALRMLLDAGTFSTMPAGLMATGMRIKGANEPFKPGVFKEAYAAMGDISRSIMPLPFKEPSPTLMNLLQFVVQAGEKFANSTDQIIQESQSYGPVGTVMALLEQGGKLFSAIHKRLHHAQGREFKILARLNFDYLPDSYPYSLGGVPQEIKSADFDGRVDVIPVSDPNLPTQAHRIAKANAIFSMAAQAPALHNMREVVTHLYESMDVEKPERFLAPLPEQAQPLDPITENINALNKQPLKSGDHQNHVAHIKAHMAFMQMPHVQGDQMVLQALAAHITEHIAADYRVQMSKALGVDLSSGQPMPPEIENELAVRAAEATEQLLNGEVARLVSEKMEDPEIQVLKDGLRLQETKQKQDFLIDIGKLVLDEVELRVNDDNRDADRLAEFGAEALKYKGQQMQHKTQAEIQKMQGAQQILDTYLKGKMTKETKNESNQGKGQGLPRK